MSRSWFAAPPERAWRAFGALAVAVTAAVGGAAAGIATGQTTSGARPAAAYLAIATAGNKRLDAGFDRLHGPDRGDLAAARNDLRDIAATERQFDKRLAALKLPPGAQGWARVLITVNEARAALTGQAGASRTAAELAGYQQRLTAANVPVEQAVGAIRAELGLPPPDTAS